MTRRALLLWGTLALAACAHQGAGTASALSEVTSGIVSCGVFHWGCQRPPAGAVPITLRGQVVTPAPTGTLPVAYLEVVLRRDGRLIDRTASDRRGRFGFTRGLEAGDYEVAVAPGDYSGALTVTVDRGTPEVVLFASRP
jgi:hypothetical protein